MRYISGKITNYYPIIYHFKRDITPFDKEL